MPERFIEQFHIIPKCSSKLDCLIQEMLYIHMRKPTLNVQTVSIRAKVFDSSYHIQPGHLLVFLLINKYFLLIVEPYSVREARIHLRRIKDLLSTNFYLNAYSAVDHLSLSFLSAVAGVDVEGECM